MPDEPDFMRSVLQRIATGPTMSKDLPRGDARRAMRELLDGSADPVRAGIFLIALRMKRESDDELAGILDAIRDGLPERALDVDTLVVLADPYDGYLRGVPVSPFLPVVLAACGLAVLTHGVRAMGPKFGATHRQVLEAAGVDANPSLEVAAARLEDPAVGWAHVDQAELAPELAALRGLRTRIVKRPCLTTVEVAVNPFVPRASSVLATGYVHKGYPPVYARLAAAGGFARSVIVRGVEGGVVPSLSQAARYFTSADGESLEQVDIEPGTLGIAREERAVALPAALAARAEERVRSVSEEGDDFALELARHAAQVGRAALDGEAGAARDALVYAGAVVLAGAGFAASMADGAERVRGVLDDGSASTRLG